MCSANDDPSQHDTPVCTCGRPLSPDHVHRGSVALAVLGEMLESAENARAKAPLNRVLEADTRLLILRSVRERIAAAEAETERPVFA